MATLSRNIPKLFLLKISRWLMLFMPTVFLFFTENGLTMTQIMVLQSAFGIAAAVLEIPSGYFSDVLGRKKTLILSGIFGVWGMSCFAFGVGFWWFLLGEILLGISKSLNSGTDSALLYDSLKALDREDDYLKLEGRVGGFWKFCRRHCCHCRWSFGTSNGIAFTLLWANYHFINRTVSCLYDYRTAGVF